MSTKKGALLFLLRIIHKEKTLTTATATTTKRDYNNKGICVSVRMLGSPHAVCCFWDFSGVRASRSFLYTEKKNDCERNVCCTQNITITTTVFRCRIARIISFSFRTEHDKFYKSHQALCHTQQTLQYNHLLAVYASCAWLCCAYRDGDGERVVLACGCGQQLWILNFEQLSVDVFGCRCVAVVCCQNSEKPMECLARWRPRMHRNTFSRIFPFDSTGFHITNTSPDKQSFSPVFVGVCVCIYMRSEAKVHTKAPIQQSTKKII